MFYLSFLVFRCQGSPVPFNMYIISQWYMLVNMFTAFCLYFFGSGGNGWAVFGAIQERLF
jgi:hypothetical protein